MQENSHRKQAEPPKRRALGKGLEALLAKPQASPLAEETRVALKRALIDKYPEPEASEATGAPLEIPVSAIDPNPYQTRSRVDEKQLEELTRSVAATGVVQPILVRPQPDGRFQLIAGERRWRASQKAGKETIPAIVRQVSDEQAMEITIIENLQRADLNPMEQARAFDRLSREFKVTQEQMALRTGKDRASITNFLRLLKLPREVQDKVESGELSFGHAKVLLALDSPDAILKATAKISALAMSVRQTETFVQGIINPQRRDAKGDEKAKIVDPNVREAQERLQRQLGLKVHIEDKNGRGRVVIEYAGLEDFDSLMSALGVSG